MSGAKDLVAWFMVAASSALTVLGCTPQETDQALGAAEGATEAARAVNKLRSELTSKVLEAAEQSSRTNTIPRQIRKSEVPKYLSEIINRNHLQNTSLRTLCDNIFSHIREELYKDGKCLGYLYGKTSGEVEYRNADVYAFINGNLVRIYKVPPKSELRDLLEAGGEMFDASLGLAGAKVRELRNENRRDHNMPSLAEEEWRREKAIEEANGIKYDPRLDITVGNGEFYKPESSSDCRKEEETRPRKALEPPPPRHWIKEPEPEVICSKNENQKGSFRLYMLENGELLYTNDNIDSSGERRFSKNSRPVDAPAPEPEIN